jgi:glycosyltransferase involved in cell wall biosynthesis
MIDKNNMLTALIITFNEIGYIQDCISAIAFADEIIVVDSFSTDGTYEYLKAHPRVKVIQKSFNDFTSQKSFALDLATNDWVLFIDADEIVSNVLQTEILKKIRLKNPNNEVAFWVYRIFMFKKHSLKFSGTQTDKNIRLFRKSKVKFTPGKLVHETLEIDGSSGILKEKLIHYCYKNYDDYKRKIINYGRLKARQDFEKNKKFSYVLLVIKPLWTFFRKYIIRFGILDGKKGFILCYLNALGTYQRYKLLKSLGCK